MASMGRIHRAVPRVPNARDCCQSPVLRLAQGQAHHARIQARAPTHLGRPVARRPCRLQSAVRAPGGHAMTWFNRPPKYGNHRTKVGDIVFDSRREARRHVELQWQVKAGEIRELRRQVPFELAPAVKLAGERRTKPAIRYVADFVYEECDTGRLIVEDVKSSATARTKD